MNCGKKKLFFTLPFFLLTLAVAAPGSVAARDLSCSFALIPGLSFTFPDLLSQQGLDPQVVDVFRAVALNRKLTIELMLPVSEAFQFSRLENFAAKPKELAPCKAAKSGLVAGLVQCPPQLFDSLEAWEKVKNDLEDLGYKVLGEEDSYLVVKSDSIHFYSDLDLLGVYDLYGRPAYSDDLLQELNRELGRAMVQHGPLADYDLRWKVGVKFPVLILDPNGSFALVKSKEELKRAESKRGIEWLW